MNMKHTSYKQKHGMAAKNDATKSIQMTEMVNHKANDRVRENFFRPAYGKIGERKEENNERSNENN